MRTLITIENEPITINDDGSISWKSKAAVDSDGIGPHHGDRTAQNETSYKPNLNADRDKYIVVPPAIIEGVKPMVLGSQGHCKNLNNGMETDVVVGDVGPHRKLGEVSDLTASALGLNPSPVSGGTDAHIIEYRIWPGMAAFVDGKSYVLQPSKA